jgi:hypothetical protein
MFKINLLLLKVRKPEKYQVFFLVYTISSLGVLLLIAIFNIIIDPYLYFYSPIFPRLNQFKPEQEKYLMLSKVAEAKHIKATTILLGSSRVMSGLDINHPALDSPDSTYNLGLPGVNIYQSLAYFKHALAYQQDIEQVIIGIDFFMFNHYLKNLENFDEERLGKKVGFEDLINNSLSLDTLESSIITFETNFNKKNQSSYQESTKNRFRRWLTNFLSFEGFYKTYSLSKKQLNYFQEIINLCQQNNIDVKVFISPTHATQYEAIAVAGLWSTFEKWKREITKITPVWDFSGYNSITTEKIDEQMNNYIDNSHYSPQTGNIVINRLLSYQLDTVPADFGVLINQDNIEFHLNKIRTDQEKWQQNNPAEVQLVKNIKAQIDQKNLNNKDN